MHLKSIELQGYKTFAGRTLLEFAESITCIVGPNGSGKSNIADAIRWVLGEQSYRLLRGKKTEDMIFSGSESRPRVGMASANIIFDNTSGWLPVDFSEVSIARRAYRDGTNEYLLNGQRVRLKDISELLGKSGLSERTYTIIGQGLVDAALALRAEDRRRLFEEAAGVSLYRSRRSEAQRRLETTRRNLERVDDILAELKPRLRSLERQSSRAEQYEQVKADLRLQLRDWYGYHWYRAQREVNSARESARVQESLLDAVQQEQADLDQKLTAFREHIQGVRARLGSWHRELSQLHIRLGTITRDLAVSDERMRSQTIQQHNAADELVRLEQRDRAYQDRSLEINRKIERLSDELNEARTQAHLARQALQTRQVEQIRAEKAVRQSRQNLSSLTNRQSQLQARLAERQAQAERQQAALADATQAAAEADKILQAAEIRLKSADVALQRITVERQAADETLQAHRQKIAETEAARKVTLDERAACRADLARLKAQLEVLEQAEKALAGYASGTRLLLKSAQKGRLPGAQGALSSQLDVPEELETAIAAALGEYVDAVLLEGDSSADTALELLVGEAARGALLPLDALTPPPPLTPSPLPSPRGVGVMGLASDLVKAPPKLRPAVDLLLGHTLVVEDRAAARRAVAGQPLTTRVVTLRGEVFYASGPISAGQSGKSGPLSRPRHRRELRGRVAETERQAAALDARLHKIEAALSDLQIKERHLVQELGNAQRQEKAAADAHAKIALEGEQARRQAQWQRDQRERLGAEIRAGETEAGHTSRSLIQLDAEISQAQQYLREQQDVSGGLSLDEFQSQVGHWNTQAAVAERALADVQNRQKEQEAAVEEAARKQAQLKSLAATLESGLAELEAGKGDLRTREADVAAQIEALRNLIEPAEADLGNSELEQEKLQKTEAQARQALSMADRRYSQAQVTLTRRQESLDTLRERIEDDLGLVAFEYVEDISGPKPLPFDEMVEQLPMVPDLPEGLGDTVKRQRAQLRRMGAINPEAQTEYQEVRERFEFMSTQVEDLNKAEGDIKEVIAELDVLMEREFRKTFDAVAKEFREIFTRLFGGGSARLMLTDPDDLTETGIDIEARLPGRRSQGLSLLSGGERSLTATALIFSLLKVSPTPFCVLDEVDAMLDEANVGRFRELLRELAENTQFIVITHNRNTVQAADVIYGVTMGRDSASQMISLKLDEVADVVREA
ncbi:MAG: chromosome segregation protein SMC [Chloroflexi bacterium]|nr:chromosome segregation protein SMC [Chloroflexota bacterium]